jgi:hypothetical protein
MKMTEEMYIGLSDETMEAMAEIARKIKMNAIDPGEHV